MRQKAIFSPRFLILDANKEEIGTCFQMSTLASESLLKIAFPMMCCLIIKDKVWWGSSGEMYCQPLRHSV